MDATGGGTKGLKEIALEGSTTATRITRDNATTHVDSAGGNSAASSGTFSGLSPEVPTLCLPFASVGSVPIACCDAESSCPSPASLAGIVLPVSALLLGEEGVDGAARSRSRPTTPTPLSKFSISSPREEAAPRLVALVVVVDRSSAVSVGAAAACPEAYESAEGDEAVVRAAAASLCSRAALSAASRARFSAISARLRSDTARANERQRCWLTTRRDGRTHWLRSLSRLSRRVGVDCEYSLRV